MIFKRISAIGMIVLFTLACEASKISFTKSPEHALIKGANQKVKLSWDVKAIEGAKSAKLVEIDGTYQLPVELIGSIDLTPPDSAQYQIEVTKTDGEVVTKKLDVLVLDPTGNIEVTKITFPREATYMDDFYFDYEFKIHYGKVFNFLNIAMYDIKKAKNYVLGVDLNDLNNNVGDTYKGRAFTTLWPMKAGERDIGFSHCDPFEAPNCSIKLADGVTAKHQVRANVHRVILYNTYDSAGNEASIDEHLFRGAIDNPFIGYVAQNRDPWGNTDEIFAGCVVEYGGAIMQFEYMGMADVNMPRGCASPSFRANETFENPNPSTCESAMYPASENATNYYFQVDYKVVNGEAGSYIRATTNVEAYGRMLWERAEGLAEIWASNSNFTGDAGHYLHIFAVDDPTIDGQIVDAYFFEFNPDIIVDYVSYLAPPARHNVMIVNANRVEQRPQYLDKMIASAIGKSQRLFLNASTECSGDRYSNVLCNGKGHLFSSDNCNSLQNKGIITGGEVTFDGTSNDIYAYDFNH